MRKFNLLLKCFVAFFLLSTTAVYAGAGWATSAVVISVNGESPYLHVLNNEGWTDGDYGSNTTFDGKDFGTPTSLVINGGAGNAWASDGDWYDATSFVINYRVYPEGETPGSWSSFVLDQGGWLKGNNWLYIKENANIDVLALVNSRPGIYTLEVVMSKKQFYNGGNWNSMIPGGQGTAYDAVNAGYKARFNISVPTGVSRIKQDYPVSVSNRTLTVQFPGQASVEVLTLAGQHLVQTKTTGFFSEKMDKGIYILRVNGISRKIVIE